MAANDNVTILKPGNVVYVKDDRGRHAVRVTDVVLLTGVYNGDVLFSGSREPHEAIQFHQGQFQGHYLGLV